MSERWVGVNAIKGGQVVTCRLCGKSFTRVFRASDTNYAEALRLAIAYASRHRMSEEHAAGRKAFNGDAPEIPAEEELLAKIFGKQPRNTGQRRREVARNAARHAVMERRSAEDRNRSLVDAERKRAETKGSGTE